MFRLVQMVSCVIKRSHRQAYRRVGNIESFVQYKWNCYISEVDSGHSLLLRLS